MTPIKAPLSATSTAGRVVSPQSSAAASTVPPATIRSSHPCNRRTPSSPRPNSGSTAACGAKIWLTDPSQPETVSATKRIHDNPFCMIQSPISHNPKGARQSASTPAGMTSAPISGTLTTFASSP